MTRVAVMIAGAVAMVVAASFSTWWVVGGQESLGLRAAVLCASGPCTSYAYKASSFATLGSLVFYGAFFVAALTVAVGVLRLQTKPVAKTAARMTAIFGVVMLGLAIAFILERPEELSFESGAFVRVHLFTRSLTIGWALIAYIVGALAVTGGGALASVENC